MSNKPRVHHFVPQFWIKKFISADTKLWGYEWRDDQVKHRSSKAVMQIFDLYTIQPSGADDTSLESNELGKVDTQGAITFDQVLNGDRSEAVKADLASFLAVQIMRDPDTLSSYPPRTQELTLHLLNALTAKDYASFSADFEKLFPGADIKEGEYNHIRGLGRAGAEQAIDAIITCLDAKGGIPELPFTDLIRSSSSRDIIHQALLSLDWEIKTDANEGLILGDAPVLFEKGDFRSGLRTPLSKTTALYLTPDTKRSSGIASTSAKSFEVEALNYESAARTRSWLVGDQTRLENTKNQVSARGFPDV